MPRIQKTKRPQFSRGQFGTNLRRMFHLFSNQKPVMIFTIVMSIIEAAMITFTTFCICVIYSNFFTEQDPAVAKEFLIANWQQFLGICLCMLGVYVFSQITYLFHGIWMAKVSEKVMYGLRRSTLQKLHLLPVKFFDVVPSGEIMTRMSSDIDNISQLTSENLSSIFFYSSLILMNSLVMFLINWYLACVTMIAVPIMVVTNIIIVKKVQPAFLKQQNSISKLNGYAEEKISGTKIISLFRMQDKCLEEFDVVNRELTKNSLFAQTASNMMMPINHFLTRIAIFVICALGFGLLLALGMPTWLIDQSVFDFYIGNIHVGGFDKAALLIVFTSFARNFAESFNNLVSSFSFVFYAVAGAQRVFQILDAKEEQDLPEAKPLAELKGKVEAKHLWFGYEKGKMILKDLNFVVKPGQTIAIVGPTGAGKTTITNLVTKFYDPDKGKLLFDDVPVEKISRKYLRQNIAVILQDTFLFAESVKNNIRYGRLDATDKEIVAAAKEAHLHDFIMQLPMGYNTILKDNGSNLSAGQRQLLTIARAFLAKPKIVILDEATSSIDTKTELLIGKAMDKLMTGKTCFVVAHRLSTIVNADNILVLKQGRIVESGTHQQLLKKRGFYYKLYDAQFKKGQQL
ncbi:MAG: ABC transporter ATP-binding protein [Mycoplasmoidaceae bacterium]